MEWVMRFVAQLMAQKAVREASEDTAAAAKAELGRIMDHVREVAVRAADLAPPEDPVGLVLRGGGDVFDRVEELAAKILEEMFAGKDLEK